MKKIIYGAGNYGNLLFEWCCIMGIVIDYFAQTQESKDHEMHGVRIITFESILKLQDEKICILLSIKDARISDKIKNMFLQANRDNIELFDMADFIEENLIFMKKNKFVSSEDYYCIICNNFSKSFKPAGIDHDIFRRYNIIGGGYRDNCVCPNCGSIDRERWLYYVMKNMINILGIKGRVLHFAPELCLNMLIKSNGNIDYYTGDIAPGRAKHITDITNIQYKDGFFDLVICNHVMEHIIEEEKAISEIKRVLNENGRFIFSVPICLDIDTYEDKSIITPDERLRVYGQEDHVRLYGKDYKEYFERFGLNIKEFIPKKELKQEYIRKWGLIENDIIMIAEKSE